MKFYDLQLFTNSSLGQNSIGEIASRARELGYSGIVISDVFQGTEKLKEQRKEINLYKSEGMEIYQGITIQPKDVNELKNILAKVRESVLVVIVQGGNYKVNRAACEDSRVDVLINPELGRSDNGLDEPCFKAASRNEVAIGTSFRRLLYSYHKARSHILDHISTNIRLSTEFNTNFILCSGAYNIWEMRGPRDIVSIANVLGLDLAKSILSMSEIPLHIIQKNKNILEGTTPVKGVEIVGEEDE